MMTGTLVQKPSSVIRPSFQVNYTSTNESILYRSSHRIVRTALPVALSRIKNDAYAIAQSSDAELMRHCLVGQNLNQRLPLGFP